MKESPSKKHKPNQSPSLANGSFDYRHLFDLVTKNSSDHVILLDKDGTVLFINHLAATSINSIPEEIIGKNYNDALEDLNRKPIVNNLKQLLTEKEKFSFELATFFQGEKRWLDITSEPILDKHGEVSAILILANDITEQKQTEKALTGAQAFHHALFNHVQEAIFIIDDQTIILDANPSACKLLSYSREELLNNKEIVSTIGSNELLKNRLVGLMKKQGFSSGEAQLSSKTGEKITFLFYGIGNILPGQHLIVGRDITRQKKIEQELIASEERYHALFKVTQEAIVIFDNQLNIVDVNPYLEKMIGYTKEEIIQKPYSQLAPDIDLSRLNRVLTTSSSQQVYQGEQKIIDRQGKTLAIEFAIIPNFLPSLHLGLMHDITERKRAVEALRDSELRYRTLFNSATDAIFIMEGNSFITCNQATVKIFGYSDESEILNHSPWEFSPETQPDGKKSKKKAKSYIKKALSGKPQNFYWMHTRKDGSPFDAEVTLNTISINGETYLQAQVRDITKRKKAEQALRESEMRYSSLVNVSPNAILIVQDQKYVFANPAAAKILGYEDPQDVIGLQVMETITSRYRQTVADREERTLAGQKTDFSLIEIQQPNGATRFIESFSIPYNYRGEIASLVIGIDVTEKITQEYMLSGFYKAAPLGVGVVIGRQIIQANEMFCRMTGYSLHELINQDSRMLYFNDEDYFIVGDEKVQQMNKIGVATTESRFRRKDGSAIDVLISSVPIDSNDWNKGINTVVLDISERKQVERMLQNLNEELEERVRVRTQQLEKKTVELESFSYSISHDLRAPLRAINGLSQILLEEYSQDWEQDPKSLLDTIVSASQKMDRLIDGLLVLSRLGQKHLSPALTDIGKLATQVYASQTEMTKNREITFTVQEMPQVFADQQLLETALTNLISNAVKFTQPRKHAKIEFGILRPGDMPVFYLKDNGVGFNMNYAGKLFTPFQRLESEEEFEGTGIGLTIVKRIIERHKGSIWVESEEGKGTTFFFTINLTPSTTPTDAFDE